MIWFLEGTLFIEREVTGQKLLKNSLILDMKLKYNFIFSRASSISLNCDKQSIKFELFIGFFFFFAIEFEVASTFTFLGLSFFPEFLSWIFFLNVYSRDVQGELLK